VQARDFGSIGVTRRPPESTGGRFCLFACGVVRSRFDPRCDAALNIASGSHGCGDDDMFPYEVTSGRTPGGEKR
jgi:hypothetical protein